MYNLEMPLSTNWYKIDIKLRRNRKFYTLKQLLMNRPSV